MEEVNTDQTKDDQPSKPALPIVVGYIEIHEKKVKPEDRRGEPGLPGRRRR